MRQNLGSRVLTEKKSKAKAAKPKPQPKAAAVSKAKSPAAKTKAVVKAVKPAKVPAAKAAPRKKTAPPRPQRPEIMTLILKALDDAKAEDITELSLIGKNPMTDYMVVASGRSQRHVQSTAELLAQKLRAAGFPANVEGLGAGDWVLVDALDVVVHLFRPEVRAFYNLEQMWMDEPAAQAAS